MNNPIDNFKFACPHCGQHLEAEPDMAGTMVECPNCGKTITVSAHGSGGGGRDDDLPSSRDGDDAVATASVAVPAIQTIVKGETEASPPPLITVVKGRESFFTRNRKWLIPVAGGAAALLLVVGLVVVKQKTGKRRTTRRTTPSSTSGIPSYYAPSSGHRGGSREFVRNHIKKNGNCRIVSITKIGGDIVVCGKNNWAANGCARNITDKLQEISDEGEKIIDVCLTELGRFVVLYGRNAGSWNNIPQDMEYHLRRLNANDEELYSATLNDAGDWIVVGSEHYACSATWLKQWLADGGIKYGTLLAAAVSTDAAVAVYDGGYKFYGNVPADLKEALRNTSVDVRIIKIAGSAWFFADKTGYGYRYNM
jgi:DNA-directed RNA polymerase subunit RPC12/RpoP